MSVVPVTIQKKLSAMTCSARSSFRSFPLETTWTVRTTIAMAIMTLLVWGPSVRAQAPADRVDQHIGRRSGAAVHLGASAPFGITNAALFGNDGYVDRASGVSLLNIQGTGCDFGALGHVIVAVGRTGVPVVNDRQPIGDVDLRPYRLAFDYTHSLVRHEATATRRCVVHRLRPRGPVRSSPVTVDLGTGQVPARTVQVHRWSDTLVLATLHVGGFCTHQVYQPIHVALRLEGVGGLVPWVGGGVRRDERIDGPTILQGTLRDTVATIAIGMSLLSTDNALENLAAEVGGSSFDAVVHTNRSAWDSMLGRFRAVGGTDDDQALWYTALFRAMQHPSVGEDVNGEHKRYGEQRADRDETYERTVNHDLWGFHQTNMGFYGAYMPDVYHNVVRTFLGITQERGEGPQFDFLGNQLYIMGGDPFPLVVHDALMRGFLSTSDVETMWPALFGSAVHTGPVRAKLHYADAYGFIPSRSIDGKPIRESVAFGMEYGMADAALARMAGALGRADDGRILDHRSRRFWHNYDTSSALFRERLLDGTWEQPFDPDIQPWRYDVAPDVDILGFKEGSGREFLFYPQHIRQKLRDTAGSWVPYVRHLDTALAHPDFALWNQVQMHLPYQYLYVDGEAHRSQLAVHRLRRNSYRRSLNGYPGNDDLGSTSLWFVHATLGLYPTLAFEGSWLVTAPLFDTVVIDRVQPDGSHRPLVVVGSGPAAGAYVRRVTVDGQPMAPTHIGDAVLRTAGIVEIERSRAPVPYPRRWSRSSIAVHAEKGTPSLVVDDHMRQTPLELVVIDTRTNRTLIDTLLLPGERTLDLPEGSTSIAWRARDRYDPAHDNAWMEGRSIIVNGMDQRTPPNTTSLNDVVLRPNPARYEVFLAGYDWSQPVTATVYDALGSLLYRDLPVHGTLNLRDVNAGTVTIVFRDGHGNQCVRPLVIVR